MTRTDFERALESMYGYYVPVVLDTPDNRYSYISITADEDIDWYIDDAREADSYEEFSLNEEPHITEVMISNTASELCPAEGVCDENYTDNIRDMFSSDSKIVSYTKGEKTVYILIY